MVVPILFPKISDYHVCVVRRALSRALLIHDDPVQRSIVTDVLSRCSMDTTVLCSDEQAWLYLFRSERPLEKPDLIILRMKLSPIGGLKILQQLRAGRNTREIPVIVLADSEEENVALKSLDIPLCFCFVKPLSFAKLVYALPRLDLFISDSMLYRDAEVSSRV